MIISVTGYGFTGATAVVDFLHGYDHVKLYDTIEFQIIHQADGILDLKYHLTHNTDRIACNTAINRFIRLQKTGVFASRVRSIIGNQYDKLSQNYIDSLVQAKWKGRSNYDPEDISTDSHLRLIRKGQSAFNYLSKQVGLDLHIPPLKDRFFSIMSEEEFDVKTKDYLKKLFMSLGIDEEDDFVLEMLFSPTNPHLGTEFFDRSKCIVVCREPRDIFIYGKKAKLSHCFMPWDNAIEFVNYYKSLIKNTYYDPKALFIQYEDLIYDYDNATQKIIDYLEWDHRPQNEFKFFDPDISVKYTNLKNSAPELEDEIRFIEDELSDYLYPFPEKYQKRSSNYEKL